MKLGLCCLALCVSAAAAAPVSTLNFKVAVFSFNAGQGESYVNDDWVARSNAMVFNEIDTFLAKNADVDLLCFSDQEAKGLERKALGLDSERGAVKRFLLGEGRAVTAETYCAQNAGWAFIEDKKFSGTTKFRGPSVYTAAGCCQKIATGIVAEDTASKDYVQNYAFKKTKGCAGVRFHLKDGSEIEFVGSHLDTKKFHDDMKRCSEKMNIGVSKVAKPNPLGILSFMTGDLNIRFRDPADANANKAKPFKFESADACLAEAQGKWEELTAIADPAAVPVAVEHAVGFTAVKDAFKTSMDDGVFDSKQVLFSALPIDSGHVKATYKYAACESLAACGDEATWKANAPGALVAPAKLCKKEKPQIGLLDFSFAVYDPRGYTVALGNHMAKTMVGSDHLIHAQVYEVTRPEAPAEAPPVTDNDQEDDFFEGADMDPADQRQVDGAQIGADVNPAANRFREQAQLRGNGNGH